MKIKLRNSLFKLKQVFSKVDNIAFKSSIDKHIKNNKLRKVQKSYKFSV